MAREFFIYDLETFGLDNAYDRIAQFACKRYDENLNPLEEGKIFYCKQPTDYLPSPSSCIITGITPDFVNENGVCEAEFARKIHFELEKNLYNTTIVGYNNTGFDDKMLRFLFFRNFLNPYSALKDRSLDCYTLMKAVYFFKKDIFKYRKNEQGNDSLKLEYLTLDNGFEHTKAHDALSDVEATAQVFKHIKDNASDIFDSYFRSVNKLALDEKIKYTFSQSRPFFSLNYAPLREQNGTLEYPLVHSFNSYYCINLLLKEDEFNNRLNEFAKNKNDIVDDSEKLYKLFDNIKLTSSPFIEAEDAFYKGADTLQFKEVVDKRVELIKKLIGGNEDVKPVVPPKKYTPHTESKKDVDESINDGFLDKDARDVIDAISTLDENIMLKSLSSLLSNKEDKRTRIKKMYSRFIARNYYESMSDNLKKSWAKYCKTRLCEAPSEDNFYKIRTYDNFCDEIKGCREHWSSDSEKLKILDEVENYGKKIIAQVAK